MKSKILSVEQINNVDTSQLPNGRYAGIWGGYEVVFEIKGVAYRARTEMGVRTMNMPCVVVVEDGKVTVE